MAWAPQSVTLRLADDIDVSRGDLIAAADEPSLHDPPPGRHRRGAVRASRCASVTACCCGSAPAPSAPSSSDIVDQLDIATMEQRTAPDGLALNAIGRVRLRLAEDVAIDDYRQLRRTGAFLLIDDADGTTLAAGMADAPDRSVGEGI